MRSRMSPRDEGLYYLLLTIFLYLPSCVHSSPKRGRFRSGLWRGGEAAPAPVEYRSAVPGGLLKAAWRAGYTPCAKLVSLPALDYAGAVSESALRRDGEGRSPMDPLRVTGSVGRGVTSLRLCGRWVFVRAGRQGQPCAPDWMKYLPPGRGRLRPKGTEETCPGERRGNLPPWIGGVTAPMPVGPFAPESKTGVPKIAERGAPGRPHRLLKHRRPGAPRPPSTPAAQPGRKPRERGSLPVIVRNGSRRARGRANIPGKSWTETSSRMSDAADTAVNRSPNRPVRKGDHVFLVDGSSYIFRAYHALPPLTRKSDGLPIGAVAGFCNMLWRLIRDLVRGREADASGRRVRLLRHHLPQRHVRPVQGAASRAAGGSATAVPADPRGGARLRHSLRGAEGLRGRRHHRHLCPRRRARRARRPPSSPPTRT